MPNRTRIPLILALGWLSAVSSLEAGSTLWAIGSSFGDASSNLYRIDHYASTPVAVDVGETGSWMCDLAVDPTTGRIYAVDCQLQGVSAQLFELNPTDGSATLVGPLGVALVNGLEFDGAGDLWAVGVDDNFYAVDKVTGVANLVGPLGFTPGGDLAFGLSGALYAAASDSLWRINPSTGAGTFVGNLGVSGISGLDVDTDGTMIALRESWGSVVELYRVDAQSGAATLIGAVSGSQPLGAGGAAFSGTVTVGYEGDGLGQVFSLEWKSGPSGQEAAGSFVLSGGAPSGPVLTFLGVHKTSLPLAGTTLLVNPTTAVLLTSSLDPNGEAILPADLSLLQQFAAQQQILIQAITQIVMTAHASQMAVIQNFQA